MQRRATTLNLIKYFKRKMYILCTKSRVLIPRSRIRDAAALGCRQRVRRGGVGGISISVVPRVPAKYYCLIFL